MKRINRKQQRTEPAATQDANVTDDMELFTIGGRSGQSDKMDYVDEQKCMSLNMERGRKRVADKGGSSRKSQIEDLASKSGTGRSKSASAIKGISTNNCLGKMFGKGKELSMEDLDDANGEINELRELLKLSEQEKLSAEVDLQKLRSILNRMTNFHEKELKIEKAHAEATVESVTKYYEDEIQKLSEANKLEIEGLHVAMMSELEDKLADANLKVATFASENELLKLELEVLKKNSDVVSSLKTHIENAEVNIHNAVSEEMKVLQTQINTGRCNCKAEAAVKSQKSQQPQQGASKLRPNQVIKCKACIGYKQKIKQLETLCEFQRSQPPMGHSNHLQKIQYVEHQKERIAVLEEELGKFRRRDLERLSVANRSEYRERFDRSQAFKHSLKEPEGQSVFTQEAKRVRRRQAVPTPQLLAVRNEVQSERGLAFTLD